MLGRSRWEYEERKTVSDRTKEILEKYKLDTIASKLAKCEEYCDKLNSEIKRWRDEYNSECEKNNELKAKIEMLENQIWYRNTIPVQLEIEHIERDCASCKYSEAESPGNYVCLNYNCFEPNCVFKTVNAMIACLHYETGEHNDGEWHEGCYLDIVTPNYENEHFEDCSKIINVKTGNIIFELESDDK